MSVFKLLINVPIGIWVAIESIVNYIVAIPSNILCIGSCVLSIMCSIFLFVGIILEHFIIFILVHNEFVFKAHPEIIIVCTAGPGSHPGNADLENGWKLANELGMPIIDEHYYEPNAYFLSSRQYNYYPRDRKTKVYLGEYAAKDKKLIDALAEGLYLLHVEQNGDIVTMTSYAPLFAKKNATNWNPDMIYFDNERTYPTCSYYVQQLFGQSSGQYFYGDCVTIENPDVAFFLAKRGA